MNTIFPQRNRPPIFQKKTIGPAGAGRRLSKTNGVARVRKKGTRAIIGLPPLENPRTLFPQSTQSLVEAYWRVGKWVKFLKDQLDLKYNQSNWRKGEGIKKDEKYEELSDQMAKYKALQINLFYALPEEVQDGIRNVEKKSLSDRMFRGFEELMDPGHFDLIRNACNWVLKMAFIKGGLEKGNPGHWLAMVEIAKNMEGYIQFILEYYHHDDDVSYNQIQKKKKQVRVVVYEIIQKIRGRKIAAQFSKLVDQLPKMVQDKVLPKYDETGPRKGRIGMRVSEDSIN